MKFGHRMQSVFEKYSRWFIAAAGVLLLSGFFMIVGRNLLAFWLLGQNKLELLGQNYAASFKLVYSPVQYWQKFVRLWVENVDTLQIQDKNVIRVFEDSRYFKHVSFVDPQMLEKKPLPGEIFWNNIEIVDGNPFLILLYCFKAKSGLQYMRLELPFEQVAVNPADVRGFAVIESGTQTPLVTALNPADWQIFEKFSRAGDRKLPNVSGIKNGRKRVLLNGTYYRTDTLSFDIDNADFHMTLFFEESTLNASADMLFLSITVLLPLFGLIIIILVILPKFRGRRYISDAQVLRLIASGESEKLEFKSSLRWDYAQNAPNKELENVILKSIAAFTNARGGRLLIGVGDDGSILGLANDYASLKESGADYFELHLRNLIDTVFGRDFSARQIRCRFYAFAEEPNAGKEIVIISVGESDEPVYVTLAQQGAKTEKFFVRSGNSSRALESLSEVNRYIKKRF